jgi:hypothetical protein
MSLEQALAELDNSNALREFCDDYIAAQMLEDLATTISGDLSTYN